MTEDVLITITGYHSMDGAEQEPVVTRVRGRYAFRNGHHFIRYEEILPEGQGVLKGMVRFADGYLSVKKSGAYTSLMEFREGKRLPAHYHMPEGDLAFEVEAEAIDFAEAEDRLEIGVRYGLHAGGSRIQESRVEVSVEPYIPGLEKPENGRDPIG